MRSIRIQWYAYLALVSILTLDTRTAAANDGRGSALTVAFSDCVEYVGIGLVPANNAYEFVPMGYELALVEGQAVIVVRVTDCAGVAVNHGRPRAARTAQVGLQLLNMDTSSDINNYQLYFATNSRYLRRRLTAAGVPTGSDPHLELTFEPNTNGTGPLEAVVEPAGMPHYALNGTAESPTAAPTSFIASWWVDGPAGQMQMRTEFPEIVFSTAAVVLSTSPQSELAALLGATNASFALLDSYNAFAFAHMVVQSSHAQP